MSQYGENAGEKVLPLYDRWRNLYRSCKFCNTQTGRPLPLDPEEPTHVAESIQLMKLSHAVITSVDRDDLNDLGAAHWAKTISEIKRLNPETTSEVLIPDFQGRKFRI